ncbi:hypothetical protein QQF64_000043 [Cirrhinus molitorella]|uniref:Uncharacterized protein n=1 Tax=Cirrhinus molitorella TaxID=172907 RepID=A0ABR3NWI0_9TELE
MQVKFESEECYDRFINLIMSCGRSSQLIRQRTMDLQAIYENVDCRDIKNKTGPQTKIHGQDEDLNHRGSRCLVLIAVSLGLICVLLLVFIILQHITITAERDLMKSYKNTVEELKNNYTDLMTEKQQLQNNFSKMEARVKDLTAEKDQIQRDSSQQKVYLENRVTSLTGGSRCLVLIAVSLGLICVLLLVFIILQRNTITAERDLIKSYKNTVEEFNQTINSLHGNNTDLMTEKQQLKNNVSWLETRVTNLTAEKDQLQSNFSSLSQKNLDLESRITSLNDELKKEESKKSQ